MYFPDDLTQDNYVTVSKFYYNYHHYSRSTNLTKSGNRDVYSCLAYEIRKIVKHISQGQKVKNCHSGYEGLMRLTIFLQDY